MKTLLLSALVLMAVCAVLSSAKPGPSEDLEPAATHHGSHGRVQIKVYRGPDSGHGHEKEGHHAPFGYWVKQPADDDHHH